MTARFNGERSRSSSLRINTPINMTAAFHIHTLVARSPVEMRDLYTSRSTLMIRSFSVSVMRFPCAVTCSIY